MAYNISQVFCFKNQGPSILCDVIDENQNSHSPRWVYKFRPLGKPKNSFTVTRSDLKSATYMDPDFCSCIDDDSLSKIKKGDDVFVLSRGRVNLASFQRINSDGLAEIWMHSDKSYIRQVNPAQIIYCTHKYQYIAKGHNKCRCGSFKSAEYQPKEKSINHA